MDDKTITPAYILYQLHLKGMSLSKIAQDHNVGRSALCKALRYPRPRWEKIIAEAIGTTPQELWPDRYDSNGVSLTHSRWGRTTNEIHVDQPTDSTNSKSNCKRI